MTEKEPDVITRAWIWIRVVHAVIFHPLSGRRPDLEATLAPDAWPALACAELS
jgi:hypothetical protein